MRAFRAFAIVACVWITGRAYVYVDSRGTDADGLALLSDNVDAVGNERFLTGIAQLPNSIAVVSQNAVAKRAAMSQSLRTPSIAFPSDDSSIDVPSAVAVEAIETSTPPGEDPRNVVANERLQAVTPFLGPENRKLRLRISAYAFFRESGARQGVSGSPLLGGSQTAILIAGPQITVLDGVVLRPTARFTSVGRSFQPENAAIGISADRQLGSVQLGAGIERRLSLSDAGRDAFAARVSLGISRKLADLPVSLSAYGQTGVVGARRTDAFAEGEARINLSRGNPARQANPGIATWAAIQPGAARVDAGPTIDIPLKLMSSTMTLRADWRFRIAGNALPRSGPTLTILTAF